MNKAEFLRDCVEYKVRKKELFWCFFPNIIVVIMLLPIILPYEDGWWIYLLINLLVFIVALPFLIYILIKIKNITKYFNDFIFYEVVLEKMHSSFRGKAYFSIEVNYQMKKYKVDSKPIFTTSIMDFFYLQLEEYMNRAVVAYNPILNEIVIVKRV